MSKNNMDEIRNRATKLFLAKHPQHARVINYYENYIQGYTLGCCETMVQYIHNLVVNKNLPTDTAMDYLGISAPEWDYCKEILKYEIEDERIDEE